MNWIMLGILVIISSSTMYLALRVAKERSKPIEIQNLALFFIPTLLYLFYNIIFKIGLEIEIKYLIIIFGAAVLFSWLGNIFSLKAIQTANNPGYSLMIQKSYTILTTILSVFLFSSQIKIKSIVAIIIVIFFMSFIVLDKKENKESKNVWILYTIGAFFAFAFLSLTLTYLGKKGIESTVINFYLCLFVTIIIFIQLLAKSIKFEFTKSNTSIILGVGVPSAVFNLCLINGYKIAPNPGYISAANAGSIALLTVLYSIFFKDSLTTKKIIGVIGILIGLIILFV